MMLISFSIQIFAQMRDYTAMVVDARNGEILPYASIYVSSEYGTMSNLEGNFTVMANEEDQIKISYIGYKTVILKASALPSIVKMEQISTTLEEITVTTAESILDKAAKLLEKDRKQAKGMKRRYFCRTTELIGNKQEMIEAFLEAESAISLNKLSIMGGRRSVLGKENETALYNTNLHYMLEISPAEIESRFWKNVITPLSDKNYKKHYESSYKLFKPKGEDAYYCITLKNKPNNNNRVIEGTLYIKAKDYRLIKFEGTVPFMSMTVESTNQLPENIKLENSFSMDFSHEKEITEVSSINYRMKGKGIECECILYPVDYIAFSDIKTKKIGKNLVGAVDKHSADSLMSKYNNVIKRTQKEEIIASASDGNRKVSEKNTAILDTSHTDNKAIRNYLERLTAFGQRIPQEKVFIHMDNSCYFLGDTIWFSAYTRETATGKPSPLSRVLYVELLNHDGYLVERKLIELNKGRGDGFFALDKNIQYSGFHELRAYTRWQLNWGEFEHKHSLAAEKWFADKELERKYYRDYHKLYSRVFPVYDKPKEEGSLARNMTLRRLQRYFAKDMDKRELTLNLFPEGGNLVAGIPNRVAFEATWDDGEWLEGWLHFGTDSFPTVHRGRGVITLTPQKDMEKEVAFITKDGEKVKAKLPEIKEEGAALQVEQKGGTVEIGIRLSASMQPDSMAMTVMHEGKVKAFFTMDGKQKTFRIDSEDLQAGVHQATVFDTQGRVYADRLFFVRQTETERPTLTFTVPKDECKPYEKIDLEINGAEGNTPISLAVRDNYGSDALFDNGNIMTEMLLASEIKGFIPEPGWYFEKDDEQRRQALDLLMMTQGWRRFDWQDMAVKGKWELTQPAEQAPIIMGKVYDYPWDPQGGIIEEMEISRKNFEIAGGFRKVYTGEERSINTAKSNDNGKIKKEVLLHAELVHIGESNTSVLETKCDDNGFKLQLPRFYGDCVFFLGASDSTKWGKEKYQWIKLAYSWDEWDNMNIKERIKNYSEPEFSIRIEHPYPRFVKPYTYYQKHLSRFSDTLEYAPGILADKTTVMKEVRVNARHGGMRHLDDTQPAFMLDAYEAVNQAIDAGLDFADNAIARTYVGDMGLNSPYIKEVTMQIVSTVPGDALITNKNGSESFKSGNIKKRFGLSEFKRAQPPYCDIPKDSVYHPKYLKSFYYAEEQIDKLYDRMSREEMMQFVGLKRHDRYFIYTDFHPRMENDKRYHGTNLPETSIAIYPFPDGSERMVYRDRRIILPGFAYPAECYSPDYSKQTPPDSVKDYRRTLYWNPNLMLDKDGKATVTLYNNARTTQISVDAAGQAADGTLLWGSE